MPINWVTAIWAMTASACVTIALPHLFIGIWQRRAMANLLFTIAARAVAAIAAAEFAIMSAQTPEQIGRAQPWGHLPVFVLMVVARSCVYVAGLAGTEIPNTDSCG